MAPKADEEWYEGGAIEKKSKREWGREREREGESIKRERERERDQKRRRAKEKEIGGRKRAEKKWREKKRPEKM